jgi:hypothetical protein
MAVIGDGLPVSQVGESRQTLNARLARYESEGLEWLNGPSHRASADQLRYRTTTGNMRRLQRSLRTEFLNG